MSVEVVLKRVVRARPGDSLAAVLHRALLPGERLEEVSTAERTFKATELEESTAVGTKPWTAQVQHQPYTTLQQRLAALEREQVQSAAREANAAAIREADAAIWGEGFVRNVAAQALLFAVGAQPKLAVTSTRFQQEASARSSRLKKFINSSSFQGTSVTSFARQIDQIIDNRNLTVHYSSLPELEQHIGSARDLLHRYSSLLKRCSL